eukprot:UN32532
MLQPNALIQTKWKKSANGKFSKWKQHLSADLQLQAGTVEKAFVELIVFQYGDIPVGSTKLPLHVSLDGKDGKTDLLGKKIPFELYLKNVVNRKAMITGYYYICAEVIPTYTNIQDLLASVDDVDASHSFTNITNFGQHTNQSYMTHADASISQNTGSRSLPYGQHPNLDSMTNSKSGTGKRVNSTEVNPVKPDKWAELKPLDFLFGLKMKSRMFREQLLLTKSALLSLLKLPSDTLRFSIEEKDQYPKPNKNQKNSGFAAVFMQLGFLLVRKSKQDYTHWIVDPCFNCLGVIQDAIRVELKNIEVSRKKEAAHQNKQKRNQNQLNRKPLNKNNLYTKEN